MSEFTVKNVSFDPGDRSGLANIALRNLYQLHEGQYNKLEPDLKLLYDGFQEHVSNIYELIDREIPLFKLYELCQDGAADNFGFTEAKLKSELEKTKKACKEFYLGNKTLVEQITTHELVDEVLRRNLNSSQEEELGEHIEWHKEGPSSIDDLDNDELTEELAHRLKISPLVSPNICNTLDNSAKVEHFLRVFNDYSASDLERLLPARY